MGQVPARRIYDELASREPASEIEPEVLNVVSGAGCYPPDDGAVRLVDRCRALDIDVLYAEASAGPGLLVAGQAYDDVYAVSRLPAGLSPVAAARQIRRQLAGSSLQRPDEQLLPAVEAGFRLKRWERQVSLIFGPQFAAKLLEKACAGRSYGRLTAEDLALVRRYLITVTGGCIEFELR